MRAATNKEYGDPTVLQLSEVPEPTIRPKQVLIQVRASDVTQGDRRLRAADFPGFTAVFGRLMFGLFRPRNQVGGTVFAGRVIAVGSEVTRFAVGDDVFGSVMSGAYAEFLAADEADPIGKMPSNMTYVQAAALPYGAVTALVFLRDLAKVQPGERVLIVGASGGTGRMAVQVAKHLGAHVTGVVGRDEELVRSLGADVIINHTEEDFTTSGKTWDVIYDATEGNHFRSFRSSLASMGRYLTLYMTIRVLFQMAITKMRGGKRAIVGVAMGDGDVLDDVRELVESGALRPVIAESHSFDEIAHAHTRIEGPRLPGSVVVEMSGDGSPKKRKKPVVRRLLSSFSQVA